MKRVLLIFIFLLAFPFTAHASILYEHREQQYLAKDVLFERNRQMTTDGMLDIHILSIPLDNPSLYIGPVGSQKALGLKESTTNLLIGTDAIAGVNGDFFGLAGTHSVPFGPVIADGKLQAVTSNTNATKSEFAAFFLGENNNPFMQYLKADVKFLNNGKENIELGIYNKIGNNLDWPVLIDRQIMTNTAAIDARFPGSTKVIVENGAISYISRWGETVDIPDGGYIVIIPGHLVGKYRPLINVGDTAQFHISNNLNIDLNRLRSAIGGGGLILSNGSVVNDSGIAIKGRQPRTAVGVSADKKKLILMTVDGRTHSIGATHEEVAALLVRYGAHDAMHLDGGGSTTMAYRNPDTGAYSVANTVSDGGQRRIINALAVFDRAPLGAMVNVGVNVSQQHVFVNTPVRVDAFGKDASLKRIDLPAGAAITYRSEPAEGGWQGNIYTPTNTGTQTVQAMYEGLNDWKFLYVHDIAELNSRPPSIRTAEGLVTELSFTGLSMNGTEVSADNGTQVKVIPVELGFVQDNMFTALKAGSGYLECSLNGVFTYVPITVGGNGQALTAFNTGKLPAMGGPVKFSGTPNHVSGWINPEVVNERSITGLHYNFQASFETQAAYMNFEPAMVIPSNPIALKMRVMGDGSGHWLRGRITDSAGKEHTIDFERNLESMDWIAVTAMLPIAPAPFTLNSIYMVETSSMEEGTNRVYFDALEALYAPTASIDIPPVTQRFSDPKRVINANEHAAALTVSTTVTGYSSRKEGGAAITTLTAKQGGIFATDKQQWSKMVPEINAHMAGYVVVVVDMNPLNFAQRKEFELLHKALSDISKMGTPVFVVSVSGTETVLTMMDGIRYIDLPNNAGNIKFWGEGKDVMWGN